MQQSFAGRTTFPQAAPPPSTEHSRRRGQALSCKRQGPSVAQLAPGLPLGITKLPSTGVQSETLPRKSSFPFSYTDSITVQMFSQASSALSPFSLNKSLMHLVLSSQRAWTNTSTFCVHVAIWDTLRVSRRTQWYGGQREKKE